VVPGSVGQDSQVSLSERPADLAAHRSYTSGPACTIGHIELAGGLTCGKIGEVKPVRWRGGRAARRPAAIVRLTSPLVLGLAAVTTTTAAMWPAAAAAPATASLATQTVSTGTATIGALFPVQDGVLGKHFCTASVVDSPEGNLLVTAAHCVQSYPHADPGLAFVPGYANGAAPYGVWRVTGLYVDSAWTSSSSPDDDVAFLTVARSATGNAIADVTGSEHLGFGQPAAQVVRVTGYPDALSGPITCANQVISLSATQLQFDCDNYTSGTSGSPFVVEGTGTARGTVIGVIGGYQQGGDSPDVSYAAAFGANVAALYRTAVGQSLGTRRAGPGR
jgi:V8-like Glu-specific endopeptidase